MFLVLIVSMEISPELQEHRSFNHVRRTSFPFHILSLVSVLTDRYLCYDTVICPKFQPFGCCWGSQVAMLQQNPTNASSPQMFPPCLLRYMTSQCPGTDIGKLCPYGARANVTTINATLTISNAPGPGSSNRPQVNMYDKNSVLTFQGSIMGVLTSLINATTGIASTTGLDQYLTRPFLVTVTGYTYTSSNGIVVTPQPIPYCSVKANCTTDYTTANGVSINYQLNLPNIGEKEAALVRAILQNSQTFCLYLRGAYPGNAFATCSSSAPNPPRLFAADPYPVYPSSNSASSSYDRWLRSSTGIIVIVSAVTSLLCIVTLSTQI